MKGMMSMIAVLALVLVVLAVVGAHPARAANFSNYINVGETNCGYSVYTYGNQVQISASVGGPYQFDNAQTDVYPNYWYTYDPNTGTYSSTQHGYMAEVYLSGRVAPLDANNIGNYYASNSFNTHGINVQESTSENIYVEWTGLLHDDASADVTISNFEMTSANGYYNEYTYPYSDGGGEGMGAVPAAGISPGDDVTYWYYRVTMYGDIPSQVPEPATMALIAFGAVGLIFRKRR